MTPSRIPKPSAANLGAERPNETPANPPGIAADDFYNCLRCGRKSEDYICPKCSLLETET